jgi:hypothetical protein
MNYMEMAAAYATQYGLDPEIFVRQMVQESNFNPDAVSPRGARGIAQIMPETARDPGYGVTPIEDPTDPEESLRFGAEYMRAMLDRYNGDYGLALAAYNAGPGAVDKAGGIPPFRETQNYVQSILGGAGKPDATGLSFGRPMGSLPSEELLSGVPIDPVRTPLMDMIQPMLRGEATPEQIESLSRLVAESQATAGRRMEPRREGIFALQVPEARTTPTAVERLSAEPQP